MACLSCETGTDHCHGTLVVHTGNVIECTESDCYETDPIRHDFVIDCFDLAGGCSCPETLVRRRSA